MSRNGKLFGVSFLVLFLEVLLIRWVSTEIRIFAYMTNLVLLACFLGVGSGCYLARRQGHPLITAAMLLPSAPMRIHGCEFPSMTRGPFLKKQPGNMT